MNYKTVKDLAEEALREAKYGLVLAQRRYNDTKKELDERSAQVKRAVEAVMIAEELVKMVVEFTCPNSKKDGTVHDPEGGTE